MTYRFSVGQQGFGLSLLLSAATPSLVQAVEAPVAATRAQYSFALNAQPLPQALSAFSRLTGLSLVYSDDAPYSLQAPAVNGQMSAEQALSQLLQGSGYTFRRADERTLTLQRVSNDGAMNLDAVNIDARSQQAQSYQPPPTSKIMRSEAPLLEIPQAIAVVPRQVLEDQQPRNLDDALVNVSGITQANTLGSTMDAVMKRGFGDNRDGSILRDGMRTVQGRNFTANVERVEVLKGPASMLYGILDPGGVINLISKKPQFEQRNAITARASTYGDGKNGSGGQLDSTGQIGDSNLAYRLVADYDDADYWRNFGNSREKTIAPSLAWFGADTTVNLSWEHREYVTPFDRGTILDPNTKKPLSIPRERRLDEPYNKTEGRSDLAIIDIEHRLDDQWKTHFAYSYNRDRYDDYQARVTGFVDSNVSTTLLTRRLDGTRDAVSTEHFGTLDLSGDLQIAGMRHELLTGVDHEYRKIFRSDLLRQNTSVRFNAADPVYGLVPEPTTVAASDSDQTDKVYSQSAFIQDSIHLNEQWILVGGARYQLYDQLAGRARPFKKNTDIDGQTWLPRAGLVYQWSDVFSLYGGYSESFKPNSTIAPLAGNADINGLDPEEGKSWEIGAKLDMPGRVTSTLALFTIDKDNVAVAETPAGSSQSIVRAAGSVRSRGIELDITGQLTDQLSLIGAYAYTDAEVTKDRTLDGNDLANVARNSGSLFAVYDFGQVIGGDRLRVGTGARYVGERAGDAENTFTLPDYTVADAFASYDTKLGGKNVKLQFNVKNMFDKTYYSSSTNAFLISIGDPRMFEVSSTLEF